MADAQSQAGLMSALMNAGTNLYGYSQLRKPSAASSYFSGAPGYAAVARM